MQVSEASSPTCPLQSTCPNKSHIKYLHQTHQCASWMCYKHGSLQLVCVHLCCWRERHFEDSLLPPGLICCSDKITADRRKNKSFLLLQGFTNLQISTIIHCAFAHTLLENHPIYRMVPCGISQLAPFVNSPPCSPIALAKTFIFGIFRPLCYYNICLKTGKRNPT